MNIGKEIKEWEVHEDPIPMKEREPAEAPHEKPAPAREEPVKAPVKVP